ncbi:hypothetical protein CONLIGDRAFT_687797 [Coniochaeta ligniaria NRRL 30616]|uniref:Uncharacterized protein n=1 Tax=Coniochaeta ligniaria NRRL 30616 TaxID=1408157 RepID=A0A1J7I3H2_9PEZI|nr:hypothetical protein CONLIGDRAFT_687797 [Coniochaeta ligniaria NRRL 30616]
MSHLPSPTQIPRPHRWNLAPASIRDLLAEHDWAVQPRTATGKYHHDVFAEEEHNTFTEESRTCYPAPRQVSERFRHRQVLCSLGTSHPTLTNCVLYKESFSPVPHKAVHQIIEKAGQKIVSNKTLNDSALGSSERDATYSRVEGLVSDLRKKTQQLKDMANDVAAGRKGGGEEEEDNGGRKWRREKLEYVETATRKRLEHAKGLELEG